MFGSSRLARQLQGRLRTRYKQLAAAATLVLVGFGLCGTDRDATALGGDQSLLGALFIGVGILGTLLTLGSIAFLKIEQRRNDRNV